MAVDPGAQGQDTPGSAHGPDALHRVVELLVYAPVGLVALATTELPRVIAAGKARVDNRFTVAKFIGKMAVTQAKSEVQRRLDAAEQARNTPAAVDSMELVDDLDDVDVDVDVVDLDGPDIDLDGLTLPEAIIELVAESPILETERVDDVERTLPIEGYDSLAASQVVGRLGSLTEAELGAIEQYETTHRARRTILGKINQLRAG